MSRFLPSLLLAALPLGALATEPPPVPIPPGMPPMEPGERAPRALRPPCREQLAMRMMIRKLLLDRYDTNHDQLLDGAERERLLEDARQERRQQALTFIRRFDTDGDGMLTPEERTAMQHAMEERRHEEGEGATPAATPPPPPPARHAERQSPRGRRHHAPRHPRPPMGKEGRLIAFMVRQLTMDAYDADLNRHLDTQESARLREDGAALYQAREAALLSRYDSDADGSLSETELQAALTELFPRPPHPHRAGDAVPPPPPPPHRPHPGHGSIHDLLDTHFDIDILINLAHPADAPQE